MDKNKRAVILEGQIGDDAEFHTVMAALRFYQSKGCGDPAYRPLDIHEIATNCGEVLSSLDAEWIDKLCERINTAPAHMLTVTVEGGIVQNIDGLIAGMAVKVMDFDHEGEEAVIESVWTHED